MATCDRPPDGWHCTLSRGHDGPCPTVEDKRAAFPHCDPRILHAPTECPYCDKYDDWQELRRLWGIAFTGHEPTDDQLPCPADSARPPGSASDHRQWGGNRPGGYGSPPPESAPSARQGWLRRALRGSTNG
jgi:hypothetical protein